MWNPGTAGSWHGLGRRPNRIRFLKKQGGQTKWHRCFTRRTATLTISWAKRLPSSATALRDTRTRSTCVTPACDVIVALYEGSKSWKKAEEAGLTVMTTAEAAKVADMIMILINDEKQAAMYHKDIEPYLHRRHDPRLRARLQHPLWLHQAAEGYRRGDDRAEGPRPHRPQPVSGRQRRARPHRRLPGCFR